MLLTNKEIANTQNEIQEFFKLENVSQKDVIRASLITEEVLLSFSEQFGENYQVDIQKSVKHDCPEITIKLRGYGFDPTSNVEERELGDVKLLSRLLNIKGVSYSYAYKSENIKETIAFSALSCTTAAAKLYEIAENDLRIDKILFLLWINL